MTDNYIRKQYELGTVNISEDVLISIVRDSIKEIDGIGGLSNTTGAEIAEMVGLKSFSKGIKINSDNERVSIDIIITVNYGYNIVELSKKVQDCVFSDVQSMTGIDDLVVNIHVAGITLT